MGFIERRGGEKKIKKDVVDKTGTEIRRIVMQSEL
jgi:hypothetical protein